MEDLAPFIIGFAIVIAGICDAIKDTLAHHFPISIFKDRNVYFWDPDTSWLNKYNSTPNGLERKMLFWKIPYPVFLTDAWHLFKGIQKTFLFIAIGASTFFQFDLTEALIYSVGLWCLYQATFHFHYTYWFLDNE